MWELYSGECPDERPCPPEEIRLATLEQWKAEALSRQTSDNPTAITTPVADYPEHGPGTELKQLLISLGFAVCGDCGHRAIYMNLWGIEGCIEHREEIVGWLREQQKNASWAALWKAALASVTADFRPSITDPAGSLVDEAIRRAKEKQDKKEAST